MPKKRTAPEGATEDDTAPWYARGLRFTCQAGCGRCCTSHGEYAYVYLSDDEAAKLARHLGMSDEAFRSTHTAIDDGHLVLRSDQPDCPFLDGSACTVYEARPAQCRTFPFWPEHLASPEAWSAVASFCPGIDRGEVHPLRVVARHVAECRR